jgi:protein-S-isoprenylcysteine O-methyltransferase Ste14
MITSTIAVASVVVLLLSMITVILRLRLRGYNALSGTPPIPIWALLTGKIAMAIPIFTLLVSALGWRVGPQAPSELQWLAMAFLLSGLGFAIPSLFQLGEELRFGLSEAQTATLKSTGLYRVSRNPLYLGFYLIAIASCLYVPYWANISLAMLAVAIHHQIILSEERFLRRQFGGTYDHYARQVRRYL